ncbi:MAG: hypothetical protein U0572_12340 [Phycisphaerales bacterium]
MSSAPLSPSAAVERREKPRAGASHAHPARKTVWQRAEAWLSRLSTKNTFYQRAFSLVYLPFAWRSGISMKRLGENRFVAVLPFTRFNRNWYNAMAGAALLGNSEVAAGLYLFQRCGGDYIVVCKEMKYRFMRPCFGPAVYEVVKSEDIDEKLATKGEFNIDLTMEVRQQLKKRGREMLVGRCGITFHCTPKSIAEAKTQARTERKRVKRGAASSDSADAE